MESGLKSGRIIVRCFVVKQASCVSRDITYSNLVGLLYDLLGVDKSKYELVLKVLYQLGGGIIPPIVITNDEDLGFFLDEISISFQHRTPLCVSIV